MTPEQRALPALQGDRLFLPGFGARAAAYRPGLPAGWEALQPPSARRGGASLAELAGWLVAEIEARRAPVVLAGHSMGAALALLAAAEVPERVAGLVLIGPAGLPITKPVRASVRDFASQLLGGVHEPRTTARSVGAVAAAPLASWRLVRELRTLDLGVEMSRVCQAGVPATVVACSSDTLVPPASCRRLAGLTGANYLELRLDGGHVWMFGRWHALERILTAVR